MPDACPLCGGPLGDEAGAVQRPAAVALGVRHDRAAFARAALTFLASCREVPDEIVATFAVPEDLVPLYVPFRRAPDAARPRSSSGVDARPAGGAGPLDPCTAVGLDAPEMTALGAIAAGHAVEAFEAGPPAGPVLLGEIDRSPGAGPAVPGSVDYLVPVWVLALPYRERPLRLLMDAGSGRFVAFAPAAASPSCPLARLEVIGHWAWLPALFCLLLAALVEVAAVRGALCAVAVVTLVGGYFAAGELRRALALARMRLNAALGGAGGERVGDPARARHRLVAMHRAFAWLPGIYAGIAVCAHVGVTAYVADHAAALPFGPAQAASLVPWSPAEANLRASPFAATGGGAAGLASLAGSDAAGAAHPATGHVLSVGRGAYPDLAAAIAAAAAGDTIRIEPGRYDGPRLNIDKDLAIEGRGDVTFVWRGGRGPFIRVAGRGTHVSFAHVRFEAYGINTAVLGDPNRANGEPPSGSGQVVTLRDVAIDSPQASAVYSTSPGAHYIVEGGSYRGAGSAIIVIDAAELVIRSYRGAPTRISSDGSGGVAHDAVGLTVNDTRRLTIDSVKWSGDPGGDIAIQGDAVAVRLGRAAEPGGAQRVLLVDDRGAARRRIAAPVETEPLRFSVQDGELMPLPDRGPGEASLE